MFRLHFGCISCTCRIDWQQAAGGIKAAASAVGRQPASTCPDKRAEPTPVGARRRGSGGLWHSRRRHAHTRTPCMQCHRQLSTRLSCTLLAAPDAAPPATPLTRI